jgi:hypothetical protein
MGNNEQLLEYRLCNGTYQHHLQPMEDLQRIQSLCKFQEKSRIKSGLPRIQPLKIWLKVRFGLQVLKSSWQWFYKCSSGNRSQTVDRLHHVTSIIFTAVLRSYTLSNQFCAGGTIAVTIHFACIISSRFFRSSASVKALEKLLLAVR